MRLYNYTKTVVLWLQIIVYVCICHLRVFFPSVSCPPNDVSVLQLHLPSLSSSVWKSVTFLTLKKLSYFVIDCELSVGSRLNRQTFNSFYIQQHLYQALMDCWEHHCLFGFFFAQTKAIALKPFYSLALTKLSSHNSTGQHSLLK